MIRGCSRCDFAFVGSISQSVWSSQRSVRIASSIALLAAVLLLAVATSMINTAIPTGSGLFTSEVGGQIAFGLFAGGIIRLLVPSAIAISLTAFWTILLVAGVIFEGWLLLLMGNDMSVHFPTPPLPTLMEVVDLVALKILPAAGAFFVAAVAMGSAWRGARTALNRRTVGVS
jgi:hypothetical protein